MNDPMERCAMLVRSDHREHEQILRELQHEPDPRFIPFVCDAVQLKPRLAYLDYDDYGAFYKKCLWVLQAIGTPEAIRAIANYAESSIPELKEQAIYRLSRITTTNK
jgi:hypothetical protein